MTMYSGLSHLESLSKKQRTLLGIVLISSGAFSSLQALRHALRESLREQVKLCASAEAIEGSSFDPLNASRRRARRVVAVNGLFGRRLLKILKICVPSPVSPEAGLIYTQTACLILRTLLTDVASRIEGGVGRSIVAGDQRNLKRLLLFFCGVAVPAALVNSILKYLQKNIKLSFMRRLTLHLHDLYCSNRAYYAASWLGGLTSADQRLTEDVEKFSHAISELYSYTFKPVLDVVLFTRSLSMLMGYKSQLMLYGYYLCCAGLLRLTSPPLAQMTAQEASLAGSFRKAHQRLGTHAEEVAFNDPPAGMAEKMILNQHLYRMLRHSRLSAFQQMVQSIVDGYLVKYGATVVALAVYAANRPKEVGGQATAHYIRAMRLLGNTSRGIGDLVLVYKRVTSLAGYTSRVSELVEQVAALSGGDGTGEHDTVEDVHTQLYLKNVSSSGSLLLPKNERGFLEPPCEPKRLEGDIVSFHRVFLSAPDGTTLVKELSFDVPLGSSVIIMGPNGSGKSSLFRVAAGLWPLQAGEITLPHKSDLFYLSQRPYLVTGSLRDQLLYPEPPQSVWETASEKTKKGIQMWMKSKVYSPEDLEERLCACLEAVELDYLLARGRGWDQIQAWDETLSGGEKQRLAMARLLFHAPKYAILDEATSAVSADGEKVLYSACVHVGITMLSIGHRPALRDFHSTALHFEGHEGGKGWRIEKLREKDVDGNVNKKT
jgi:ABC-type uncharacterized transport system fused permease/ATPase subunit